MTTEIDAWAAALVATFPPLSSDAADRLVTVLLRDPGDAEVEARAA